MLQNNIYKLFAVLLFANISLNVFALSDDSSKPINIKADSAEINDITGVSIYQGNVNISQGSMVLTGDEVIIQSANKKVKEITATGELSTFQMTTDDGKTVYAEASKMVYTISASRVVLTGKAKLTESGNSFSSERITFYMDDELVNAGSDSGDKRVNITVLPETIEDK